MKEEAKEKRKADRIKKVLNVGGKPKQLQWWKPPTQMISSRQQVVETTIEEHMFRPKARMTSLALANVDVH